jgi:Baculovirus FP protein
MMMMMMSQQQQEMSSDEKIDMILKKLVSMEPLLNQIPGMIQNIQSMDANLQHLNTRVASVETNQAASHDDIEEIKVELDSARGEVNALRQKSICNELVFYGLPPQVNNTNQLEVLKEIGEQLNEPLDMEHLQKVFTRKNKNNTESMIIATFKDNNQKERIKREFKQRVEPIIVEDVVDVDEVSHWRGRNIYVVLKDQLTPENRKLLKEAKKYKGSIFKHVWPCNGRILMRKEDDSIPIEVRTITDINKAVDKARNL